MILSVVIPVLNERQTLPATIAALRACRGIDRIIVADGGSHDGTREWLRAQPGIVLVNSARGKGPQVNAGAAAATGSLASANVAASASGSVGSPEGIVLFLHADCLISQPALNELRAALADERVAGGAFLIRFSEDRPRSLRLVAWGINLRARLRSSATGDQGIFVRKSVFTAIGGAPDWPLFEDVELVRRIKKAGSFIVLKSPLTISARRYIRHGVLKTALLIYLLRLAYWLGISPLRLKKWFSDTRET